MSTPRLMWVYNKQVAATPWHFSNSTYIHAPNDHPIWGVHNAMYRYLAKNPPRHHNDCGSTCDIIRPWLVQRGIHTTLRSGNYIGHLDPETQELVRKGNLYPTGSDHVWLEGKGGLLIDPTAGQFAKGQEIDPKNYIA